jgi:hypothetical protein
VEEVRRALAIEGGRCGHTLNISRTLDVGLLLFETFVSESHNMV